MADEPKFMTKADVAALMAAVSKYRARTGDSETALCRAALGNPNYLSQVRVKSRGLIGWPKARKLLAFMEAHPAGLKGAEPPPTFQTEQAEIEKRREEARTAQEARKERAKAVDRAEREARAEALRRKVEAEASARAESRASANLQGGVVGASRLNVADLAVTMLETPRDAMRVLERRWPELAAGIFYRAQVEGQRPGDVLISLIERGLAERGAA